MYSDLQKLFALMSYGTYRPSEPNSFDLGSVGWSIDTEISSPDRGDGFDATVFVSATGKAVVAFRGTDGPNAIDWWNNVLIGKGERSAQVDHAIETVADAIFKYGASNVQFTGHSLGGGLASLMSVFFDRPAYIFAPAPFENSATNLEIVLSNPPSIENSALVQEYFTHYFRYQVSQGRRYEIDGAFSDYAAAFAASNENGRALYDNRQQNVTGMYLEGEILDGLRHVLQTIGPDSELKELDLGNTSLANGGFDDHSALHDMLLHSAFVYSEDLVQASKNLDRLAEAILDQSLYGQKRYSEHSAFLVRLLRASLTSAPGTSPLDLFAQDLIKLGTSGSTQLLQYGLISAALQRYYDANGAAIPGFFQSVPNGVSFDVTSLRESADPTRGLDRLVSEVAKLPFSSPEDLLWARPLIGGAELWSVQAGVNGLSTLGVAQDEVQIGAAADLNHLRGGLGADLLIGGTLADILEGGGDADVLLGGAGGDDLSGGDGIDYLSGGTGTDILDGGAGDDELRGGSGLDDYRFTTVGGATNGADRIVDSDGGRILIDGIDLAAGTFDRVAANGWRTAISGIGQFGIGISPNSVSGTYTLVISGASIHITIADWSATNNYGFAISPTSGFSRNGTNVALRAHDGSGNAVDFWQMYGSSGLRAFIEPSSSTMRRVALGIEAPMQPDSFSDEDASPYFLGTSGNDFIAGTDIVDANGAGGDYIDGGAGDDFITGGRGADVILGGSGNDWIRGSLRASYSAGWNSDLGLPLLLSANGWGLLVAGTGYLPLNWAYTGFSHSYVEGDAGNFIDGGAGSDDIEAGGGADTVSGGADADKIRGGGGGDVLFGDGGNDTIYGDGFDDGQTIIEVTRDSQHGADVIDGGAGDDRLLGQGGNDTIYGGADNDQIFGDSDQASFLSAMNGSDVLYGNAGNDLLVGGGANDILFGGSDNDTLYGDAWASILLESDHGDDILDGESGDDILLGGGGTDQLEGGDGADYLEGGSGSDFLSGGAGEDSLVGDGSDVAPERQGNDRLDGGDGNDYLAGGGGNDTLNGDAGNDSLLGGSGDDTIDGGAGLDYVEGGDGNDLIFSDGGGELLRGGAGDDTYIIDVSNGMAQIEDDEGANSVVISGAQLTDVYTRLYGGSVYLSDGQNTFARFDAKSFAGLGSLSIGSDTSWHADELTRLFKPQTITDHTLQLASGVTLNQVSFVARGDDVVLLYSGPVEDWVDLDALYNQGIYATTGASETYGFDAGSRALVLTNWYRATPGSYVEYVQDANLTRFDLYAYAAGLTHYSFGTAQGDILQSGGFTNERFQGYAGNDSIRAGSGQDRIEGGQGNDFLAGDLGQDDYVYNIGDGADVIFDAGDYDSIEFGPGINESNIAVTGVGSSLVIQIGGPTSGDSITIRDGNQYAENSIEMFRFGFFGNLSLEELQAMNTGDRKPVVANPIADVTIPSGEPFSLQLAPGTFTDPNAGQTLLLSAALADGQPLPSWLTFDPATRMFTGTPPAASSGSLHVSVLATDPTGLFVSDGFDLNYGAFVISGTAGDDYLVGTPLSETLKGFEGQDTLWGAEGDDVLIGGPGSDFLTGYQGNDKYVFNVGDGDDTINSYEFPTDVDTISFGPGILPSDVTFLYSGNDSLRIEIGGGAGGSITVQGYFIRGTYDRRISAVTFADAPGASVTAAQIDAIAMVATEFDNRLRGTNGADTISALGGADFIVGMKGNDTLNGGAGNDRYEFDRGDGADTIINPSGADVIRLGYDVHKYEVVLRGVGADLVIEIGGPLSGDSITIKNGNQNPAQSVGRIEFPNDGIWTAVDIESLMVGDRRPVVAASIADQILQPGQSLSFQIPSGSFTDANAGEVLSLSAAMQNGDPLPGWLTFNPTTRTLSGTPPPGASGNLQVSIKATDPVGLSASDTIAILFGEPLITGTPGHDDGNDAPILSGTVLGDRLEGLAGNDVLHGLEGNDTLVGGPGNDELDGGAGNDKYVFNIGDGGDDIHAEGMAPGDIDTLEFGPGILPGNVVFTRIGGASLQITIGGGSDAVYHDNFFAPEALNARLARITFVSAPGTVITAAQIDALVMVPSENSDYLRGTTGNDTISGLGGSDAIYGIDGNDTLDGGSGNDELYGGAGNDTLNGGANDNKLIGGSGNDTYLWDRASGATTIKATDSLPGDLDILRFGAGVSSSGVRVVREFDSLVLFADSADPYAPPPVRIAIEGDGLDVAAPSSVDEVRFVDEPATMWTAAQLRARALLGGNGNETIAGYSGDDTLRGGGGDDILQGGAGADTYLFGSGQGTDIVYDTAGANRIQLDSGLTPANVTLYRIASRAQDQTSASGDALVLVLNGTTDQIWVQNFFAAGTPSTLNELAFGNGTVWSNATILANVTNIAGTANTVTGTSGNDNFTVDHRADLITEAANQGTDTVTSSVGWTLANNLENLTLTGSLNLFGRGNSAANVITGNSGANYLFGDDGIDTLTGGAGNDRLEGGRGDDALAGGTGDDIYVVETEQIGGSWNSSGFSNIRDVVTELAGEGTDTIVASAVYSLTMTSNVEILVVSGIVSYSLFWSGSDDVRRKFTGNSLDNVIDARLASSVGAGVGAVFNGGGAGGEIVLDGGAGADTMVGGNNLRTRFVVDNLADVVYGNSSEDTVETALAYTLGASIENLTLVGSSAVNGTGNASNNFLDGSKNSAANLLTGGAGNDTYRIGAGDTVVESASGGNDTIEVALTASGATYSVASYQNIENLTLLSDAGSSGLRGDGQANTLAGNTSANTLVGGDGNDTLRADNGNDWYDEFTLTSGADVISETGGTDNIRFLSSMDIPVSQLDFQHVGSDLLINVGSQSSIRIQGWYSSTSKQVEWLYVTDDARTFVYSAAEMQASADGINLAPRANLSDSVTVGVGETLNYALASNAFLDLDSQNSLSFSIAMEDGSALPSWLLFDASTGIFSGVAGTSATAFNLIVTATDAGGLSASNLFTINVETLPIIGTEGIDVLTGGPSNDEMYGLGGNDTMSGLGGDDFIDGGDGNDTLDGGAGMDAMFGGLGDDVYFVDSSGDEVTEESGEGTDEVRSTVDYTLGSNFEKLTLLGAAVVGTGNTLNNVITGNALANTLSGGSGNDTLDGGAGADDMTGGQGNDIFVVDNAGDIVRESSGQGTDTVQSNITIAALAANVENLTLTGVDAINGTGNTSSNTILGNGANNTLNAGTAGTDSLQGGGGNDTYEVDHTGVTVTEGASAGTDTVFSSVAFTLGSNVENLTLTGAGAVNGTGNGSDNLLIGNTGNNTLTGNGGNDTLNAGTAGTDTLQGNAGNDIYVVDHAGVTVTEVASEGTDTLQASITVAALAANVENLTLTGSAAINGTGNTLNNLIIGNGAANLLNAGTAGTDTLQGGAGDDTYEVDHTGVTVTENAGEGTDLVKSTVAFTLGSQVENLTLTGSAAVNGTGNTLDNILTGNSGLNTLAGGDGNDTLDGGSGGNDILQGGLGNDTFIVDRTGLTITEAAGAGNDTVQTSIAFSAWIANIENLTFTGSTALSTPTTTSAANNMITGNAGSNTLDGGAGDDIINGGGGTDSLVGGLGADTYRYTSGGGADTINNVAADSLIDRLQFTDLASTSVTLSRTGNDLIMTRVGTPTDKVTVTNWFAATANRLDFVNFTNREVTAAQIDTLVAGGGGSFPLSLLAPPAETFALATARDRFSMFLVAKELEDPTPQFAETSLLAGSGTAPVSLAAKAGAGASAHWEPIQPFNRGEDVAGIRLDDDEVFGPMTLGSKSALEDGNHPVWRPIKSFLDGHSAVGVTRLIDAMASFGVDPVTDSRVHAGDDIDRTALQQLATGHAMNRAHYLRTDHGALPE